MKRRLRWCRGVSVVLAFAMAGGFVSWSSANEPADPSEAISKWLDLHQSELVSYYKILHQNPELSFQEVETSKRVAAELKALGAEVTTGVGRHGVVGVLKNGPGATVLIRTDLDALPVIEATKLDYASKVLVKDAEGKSIGVMHACGHDIHMTCLVGVGRWLAEHRDRWSGTVVLVGQPAEELVSGARAMLEDGLYTKFPKPDFALAMHVTNDQPTGVIAYTSGPAMASSTAVNVSIKGRGGHGAAPHLTVDPIVLAALVILDLQTISSREIDPLQPCVVTVGSIHGGTKHNIISDEVKLQLTLRSYREDVRDQLIDGIKRRIKGLAEAHRAPPPVLTIAETTPPTVNTPALVERIVPALKKEMGDSNVLPVEPLMGAEDFGLFGNKGEVPTFMFRLGTIDPARLKAIHDQNGNLPSLHSSGYFPDPEASIRSGVRAMSASVLELLPPSKSSK